VCHGFQAQTAECLVVGEIATQRMLVVMNKVDLLPAELRSRLVAKARKRLAQTFAATTFAGCPIVAVSAKPGTTHPRRSCSWQHPFNVAPA
jgi:selenocysteine-specific elongation factor